MVDLVIKADIIFSITVKIQNGNIALISILLWMFLLWNTDAEINVPGATASLQDVLSGCRRQNQLPDAFYGMKIGPFWLSYRPTEYQEKKGCIYWGTMSHCILCKILLHVCWCSFIHVLMALPKCPILVHHFITVDLNWMLIMGKYSLN